MLLLPLPLRQAFRSNLIRDKTKATISGYDVIDACSTACIGGDSTSSVGCDPDATDDEADCVSRDEEKGATGASTSEDTLRGGDIMQ
jgi:hypothetical protein